MGRSGPREQCLNRAKPELCGPAREIRTSNVYTCSVQSHLLPALEKYVRFVHDHGGVCTCRASSSWCFCGLAKRGVFPGHVCKILPYWQAIRRSSRTRVAIWPPYHRHFAYVFAEYVNFEGPEIQWEEVVEENNV